MEIIKVICLIISLFCTLSFVGKMLAYAISKTAQEEVTAMQMLIWSIATGLFIYFQWLK